MTEIDTLKVESYDLQTEIMKDRKALEVKAMSDINRALESKAKKLRDIFNQIEKLKQEKQDGGKQEE